MQRHSDETKAAVMAALLVGQSVSEVARTFNLDRHTVRAWRQAAGITASPIVPQEKTSEIGDLVVDLLRANLHTLRLQQEFFRDEAWLRKQSASELAVLHGVTADKSFRILEAIDRAGASAGGA